MLIFRTPLKSLVSFQSPAFLLADEKEKDSFLLDKKSFELHALP
ncbi:MAG: hypothetical protein U0469_01395 [Candidatus Paceibacterota bacterium]|jgi:hypothetical protein